MSWQPIITKIKRLDPVLILILCLAGSLRLVDPGLLPAHIDELNLMLPALRLARHGEMTWLGTDSTFHLLKGHSPFSVYVTALPALISAHPYVLRFFYGIIGVVTVGVSYALVNRFAGKGAGWITALMMAVMPLPVYWSRFVWNPNLAPLFLLLWLYTAIPAYVEQKRHMQVLHWLLLALVIQSQTALLVVAPLSIFLTAHGFWQAGDKRRAFLMRHGLIGIGVAETFIPWLIGLMGDAETFWSTALASELDAQPLAITGAPLGEFINTFSILSAAQGYYRGILQYSGNPADWWFPVWLHPLLYGQAVLIAGGMLALTVWHWRRRTAQRHFATLLTVALFWSPGLLVLNRPILTFYMMLTTYAAICAFGWVAQSLYRVSRYTLVVPVVFILAQLWLTLSVLDWNRRDPLAWPLREMVTTVADWTADDQPALVWENNPAMDTIRRRAWGQYWQVLGESYPLRYVDTPLSLPLAPMGTTVVLDAESVWFADWLTTPRIYGHPERTFRAYTMTVDDFPEPDMMPQGADQFGQMAAIEGLYIPAAPRPNTVWYAVLYWQPLLETDEPTKFALRLTDETGMAYGQTEQLTLDAHLWRPGDRVVSIIGVPVGEAVPATIGVELRLISYSDGQSVPLAGQTTQDVMRLVQAQ